MHKEESIVFRHLCPLFNSALFATMITFALGAVSGLIGTLVGPSLKVLTITGEAASITAVELFGSNFAYYIDRFFGKTSFTVSEVWMALPLAIISVSFIKSSLIMSQWFLWERIGEKVSLSVRRELMFRYISTDPSLRSTVEFERQDAKLSSAFTADIKLLREYIVRFYGGIPREGFQAVFYVIVLLTLSPRLFGYFFIGVLPAGIIAARLGKKIKQRTGEALENFSILSEWLQQRLMGIEMIKHYRSEDKESERMSEINLQLFEKFVRSARVKARTAPQLEVIAVTVTALLIGLCIYEVRVGKTSGAVMMSFLATLGMLSQSFGKLGKYYSSAKEGAAASSRLLEIMAWMKGCQVDIKRDFSLESDKVVLELQNLSYIYPETTRPAIKHFTYQFEKGKIYCLKGPSGCGKSTLFKLFLGLYCPTMGSVSYNKELQHDSIGYLPQDMKLLPASLGLNISYPKESFDPERIQACLEKVGLSELLSSSDGPHVLVGTGGRTLSGGQVQRVFLARILYHDFKLIFMDEATSALDPTTEKKVLDLMHEMKKHGSCIVKIAHRQSSIDQADVVIDLETISK